MNYRSELPGIALLNTDFVLINDNGRYLHKSGKGSTDNLNHARAYKTYRAADRRCVGTNWKYIRVDEIEGGDTMTLEVNIPCSRCGEMYSELKVIVDWLRLHPAKVPVCIQCDVDATQQARVVLTPKGKMYLEKSGEVQ